MSSATTSNTSTTSTTSIVGIVLGSVAALLIIIAIVYFIKKRRAGANVTPTTMTPTAVGNMRAANVGNNGLGPNTGNYR